MPFTIFWSTEAELSYQSILEYLQAEWTEREIKNFIKRTDDVLEFIQENPSIYQRVKANTFKAVLSRQVALYYKIDGWRVILQYFWDTRQDPNNLKLS